MLKINCCGQDRTTSYCPECGKKLEHPLSALHRHLDGVVKIDAAKLETIKKDTKEKDANPVIHQRRVARVEKTLAKWTSWRDSVKDTIGGSTDSDEIPEPKEPELDKGTHRKKSEPETPAKKSTK